MMDAGKEMEVRREHPTTAQENMKNKPVYVPKVDIVESTEAISLLADMPGVDEGSVDIVLEKGVLTISGTVEAESYSDHRIAYAEYGTGDYRRSFTVTDSIDHNRIEATMKNGVLTLVLPKGERAKPKKISVKTA